MGAIIVAMPKITDSQRIADIIKNSEIPNELITCSTGSDVLRRVEDMDVDLVVGTKAFSDMGFEELVNYLPMNVKYVLLTKDSTLNYFSDNLVKLMMPFKPSDFVNTLRMLLPDFIYHTKRRPKRSKEEQRTIDEAKRVLMEPSAFASFSAAKVAPEKAMTNIATRLAIIF